mmetsp:Transcript_94899/g.142160  ORF Transcript_94899/g.142160 Transcript_94899/m.142160 type:complete len:203 (-) Transcript_94899:209-817(-)
MFVRKWLRMNWRNSGTVPSRPLRNECTSYSVGSCSSLRDLGRRFAAWSHCCRANTRSTTTTLAPCSPRETLRKHSVTSLGKPAIIHLSSWISKECVTFGRIPKSTRRTTRGSGLATRDPKESTNFSHHTFAHRSAVGCGYPRAVSNQHLNDPANPNINCNLCHNLNTSRTSQSGHDLRSWSRPRRSLFLGRKTCMQCRRADM